MPIRLLSIKEIVIHQVISSEAMLWTLKSKMSVGVRWSSALWSCVTLAHCAKRSHWRCCMNRPDTNLAYPHRCSSNQIDEQRKKARAQKRKDRFVTRSGMRQCQRRRFVLGHLIGTIGATHLRQTLMCSKNCTCTLFG